MVPPGVSEYRDGMCWGSVICTRRTGMLAVVVILLMLLPLWTVVSVHAITLKGL